MRWQAAAAPLVETIRSKYDIPGMILARQRDGGTAEFLVSGEDASGTPLAEDTLIPVASITKLATTLMVLRLAADKAVTLDDPLAEYLPQAAAAQDGVRLRSLLCHSSGLPYDVAEELAPYDAHLNWRKLAEACLATELEAPPRTRVSYSNVGFGLLAVLVERLTAIPFREALARYVFQPLHVQATLGIEPPSRPAVIAGEWGEHAGTALEPYNSAFWRSLALPWGGMLADAAGVLALMRAFTAPLEGFIHADLLSEAVQDQTGGLGGGFSEPLWWQVCPWGLGVELRGDKSPHWTPAVASPRSFGHAGASGCLVWHDPAASVTWAILGTRTFRSWWSEWPAIGALLLEAHEP